ncbi:MAG: hypothetical protein IPH54_22500 [Rhodoferax sp.]|jgi:hypothetical protein|nr:hypothetical protein [Rhodoferax sp.]
MNFNQRGSCSPVQCFSCKSLIYIDFTTQFNTMKYVFRVILNEKVGCSIHLSGTNRINDLRVVVASSTVICHTHVTVDGILEQHWSSVPFISSARFRAVNSTPGSYGSKLNGSHT